MSTLFDKILSGEMKSWKIWEDDNYLAFLTPFPNTPGFSVLIPKINKGDYIFELEDDDYAALMMAARKVAKLLERAFKTPRVAVVVEGTGVAHVHVKLIPLHGELAAQTGVWHTHQEFYPEYVGYITSVEGPRMTDAELDEIQARIMGAAE